MRHDIDFRDLAIACARVADDKKATNIVILDLREHIFILDYFVIATGTNRRQLQAICDEIKERLSAKNARLLGVEGYDQAEWILMDWGGLLVHLFTQDARKFYDLELLWGDSPRIQWGSSELHPSERAAAGP